MVGNTSNTNNKMKLYTDQKKLRMGNNTPFNK